MRYLYLYLEIILYSCVTILYLLVFSRYRYHPVLENRLEKKRKTAPWKEALFLAGFSIAVAIILLTWNKLYPSQFHHAGYFGAFFTGTIVTLAVFRKWINHVDLTLCFPSMIAVWAMLLAFEAILLHNNAGWIYTDSTVLAIKLGQKVTFILENLIFFYLFSPFMSILIFTRLAYKRSDITAFFLTNLIVWGTGLWWEYVCIGLFNLWYMVTERSILPFSFFGAKTTIEEMLYYVPFASISILMYLMLYYRKYRYDFVWAHRRDKIRTYFDTGGEKNI
ncbi:MAG: hypothetical protein PHC61_04445 [Chitinivibrionales bacterium]|nr:hypothetical protein [Chitinivibrionales bacterium]